MQRLSDISTIRAVMEKNGFSFSKALGQNFLINPSVCPRMAEMSGAADCGLDAAGALYGYGSREELAPFHPVLLAESCADLADQLLEQRA